MLNTFTQLHMSPTLNCSFVLQCFKCGNTIRNTHWNNVRFLHWTATYIYIYEKPTVQLASVGSLSVTPVTSLEIEPCNL